MKNLCADLTKPLESLEALYKHLCKLSDVSYLRSQKIENYISEKVRVVGEIRRLADDTSDVKALVYYADLILRKSAYIPHDIAEAEDCLMRASKEGSAKALFTLARLYSGKYEFGYDAANHEEDIDRVLNELKELSKKTAYADFYLSLYNIEAGNEAEGVELLEKAFSANIAEAIAFKAHAFLTGDIDGIDKDGKKAYTLFRKAYERCVALGDDKLEEANLKYEILYHMGCMYINGWGVLVNRHTGRCLIIKASEKSTAAQQYCSRVLLDQEWYDGLKEEVKNLDIDSLFEGSSPALDFGKSNSRKTTQDNTDEAAQSDDGVKRNVFEIVRDKVTAADKSEDKGQNIDAFDPMAQFSDPDANIKVHEYEDEYEVYMADMERGSGGHDRKEGTRFKDVKRRSPKMQLEALSKEHLDEIFKPLDSLVGLNHIKREVRSMVNLVQLNRMRETKGLPSIPVSMHMVFHGPPGTGKTTVARLIGDILWEIGYLDSGHVIDVARQDLVGEYIGWTANMTQSALDEAKGGIFFLDEAYTLSNTDDTRDFGHEAIDVINKYIEDNRDDFICIVAGYKDEMQNFMNTNPGLKSRFKHELEFKPMDKEQLMAVYESFCDQYKLKLSDNARSVLDKVLHSAHRKGLFHKSNARGARDMFERMLVKQAERLSEDVSNIDELDLSTITQQDIYTPETVKEGNVTFLSSNNDD